MKPSNESDRGELEPDAPRGARPVLRGRDAGDSTPLPGEEHTLFTVAEAAAQLGISPETLRTAARVGTLKVVKFSPRLNLVTPEAIEAYRRAHLGRSGRPKGARNKSKDGATRDTGAQAHADNDDDEATALS